MRNREVGRWGGGEVGRWGGGEVGRWGDGEKVHCISLSKRLLSVLMFVTAVIKCDEKVRNGIASRSAS